MMQGGLQLLSVVLTCFPDDHRTDWPENHCPQKMLTPRMS